MSATLLFYPNRMMCIIDDFGVFLGSHLTRPAGHATRHHENTGSQSDTIQDTAD